MDRILIVASEYPPIKAGIANLTHSVYTELRKRGEDVFLLVPEGSETPDPDRQFPFFRRKEGSFQWPIHIRNSLILRSIIRGHQIAQVLFLDAAARCFPFPWMPVVPAIVYLNGTELISRSFWGELISGRFLLQCRTVAGARAVICISEATREVYRRIFPDKPATVIYPSYDERRIYRPGRHAANPYGDNAGKLIFLTVARIAERKGHDLVLRILADIKDRLPAFHYCIVGRGPETENLRRLAASLGLATEVSFAGPVPDEELGGYYHHADIFIQLSKSGSDGIEGFGITYIEASASGTVVVGSDHGGAAEAVHPGVSGITVPPREESAREILALALDAETRRRLAISGEAWARENFSGEMLYRRFKEVLEAGGGLSKPGATVRGASGFF